MSMAIPLDYNKRIITAEGTITRYSHSTITNYNTPVSKFSPLIPVENISCPVLLVYGTDDLNANPNFSVSFIRAGLKKRGKENLCSVLCYPNAGHLIEPPYTPHCYTSYMKNLGKLTGDYYLAMGGETKDHARAQEDAWTKILTFLQRNVEKTSKSKL